MKLLKIFRHSKWFFITASVVFFLIQVAQHRHTDGETLNDSIVTGMNEAPGEVRMEKSLSASSGRESEPIEVHLAKLASRTTDLVYLKDGSQGEKEIATTIARMDARLLELGLQPPKPQPLQQKSTEQHVHLRALRATVVHIEQEAGLEN